MNAVDLERPAAPLLIFDIETVPDGPLLWAKALADELLPAEQLAKHLDSNAVWGNEELTTLAQKVLNYEFPPHLYHCVVSVCALYVHPESYSIVDGAKFTVPASLSYEQFLKAEAELIENFWNFSKKHATIQRVWYDKLESEYRLSDFQRKKLKPIPVTFCGYNISGFDLPVIEQRSFRHLVTCPIAEYTRESGYDSYRSRYGFDKTFDIYQYINATTNQGKVGLDALARAIGLAGKMKGMEGSKVAQVYFKDRDSQRIEDYCAVDVLITYGVLLGLQKFRGILDQKSFQLVVAEFQTFLLKQGRPKSYRELESASAAFFKHGVLHYAEVTEKH